MTSVVRVMVRAGLGAFASLGAIAGLGAVAVLAAVAGPPAALASQAAPQSQFVSFGRAGQGVLWSAPERGERARIGVVLVNPVHSSLGSPLCKQLAALGYLALCADGPRAQAHTSDYEPVAATIRAAIARLREEPRVRAVALVGHGEGGALALFYQNVARNGPAACQGPEKIAACDAGRLANLIPADGLLLLDPDLGQAFMTLTRLDPAVMQETAPTLRHGDLDMYDPRNGFDPGRNAGAYPPAFRKAFFAAQGERGARLMQDARKLLSAVAARDRDAFSDDMPLFVAGARSTPLWQVDPGLLSRTRRPHKVLGADGAVGNRVLASIAPPSGNPREAGSLRAAAWFTARHYLASHAIVTTHDYDVTADDVRGVVWGTSMTSALSNAAGVRDPILLMAMTAHYALRPAEMILDAAASSDKELVGVEGATHALTPCGVCPEPAAAYGDTLRRTMEYVDRWLLKRF